jgi:hypothetical protein
MACPRSPHRLAGVSLMALEANKNGVQEAYCLKRSKRGGRAQPSSPEVKRGRSRVVRRDPEDGPKHPGLGRLESHDLSFDEEKESAKRAKDVTIRMKDAGDLLTVFARAARYGPNSNVQFGAVRP